VSRLIAASSLGRLPTSICPLSTSIGNPSPSHRGSHPFAPASVSRPIIPRNNWPGCGSWTMGAARGGAAAPPPLASATTQTRPGPISPFGRRWHGLCHARRACRYNNSGQRGPACRIGRDVAWVLSAGPIARAGALASHLSRSGSTRVLGHASRRL